MQAVFDQNLIADSLVEESGNSLGEKIGVFGKLFGCWHKRLSRPVTRDRVTFRSCIDCGARRKFDMERFQTMGPFYYPPTVNAGPFRTVT
ncbi:MAG: hypothetical protein ACRD6X_11025 [Pyrinomonadaceae bacterium]